MSVLSNPFVLGYHGCRRDIGEAILADADRHLKFSDNAWDWLGKGVYFWEADPRRGYEWAVEACKAKGGEPFVIGAVIHLGNCLDLMDRGSLDALKSAYRSFEKFHARSFPGSPLPENKRTTKGPAHNLDCAVINHLHQMLAENVDADGLARPEAAGPKGVFPWTVNQYEHYPNLIPGPVSRRAAGAFSWRLSGRP